MRTLTSRNDRRPAGGRRPPSGSTGEPAIRTAGLSKAYRGNWSLKTVHGLRDLNLDVRRGEVLGLLGPNGAGKTTTLKLLTGLLKPTAGEGWIFGEPIARVASRRNLGFLPEQPYFYEYLTGLEYLELAGRLSGLTAQDAHQASRHWLTRVGLGERPQLRLRKYSKGMLQRLGLAAALIHEPDLLILDEPMSGLDPFGRRDVRDLILEQRERGVTVLFSSHILPDVEVLCDRVAILLGGRLSRVATVGELVSDSRQSVEIRCSGVGALPVPTDLAGVLARQDRPYETAFLLDDDTRLNQALGWLLHSGAQVRAVTPQRATLEQLFLAAAAAAHESAGDARRSA